MFAAAAAAPLFAVSATTMAQAASDTPQLEEVLVTATRRSERLQDVPLSITAFSQEELTAIACNGFAASFMPDAAKPRALAAF